MSFRDIMDPEEFMQRLMHSTQVMTDNDGKLNNAEFFMNDFTRNLQSAKEDLWLRFEKFYDQEFVQFKSLMKPLKNTLQLMESLKERGLKIVIASNPMFPENVQNYRLSWAGLTGFEFERITHAKNSTYCKPNLNYYREICTAIQVIPENCLMVGNDRLNDMIAGKVGMKAFLTLNGEKYTTEVSREFIRNTKFELPEPDFKGKLEDVLDVIRG